MSTKTNPGRFDCYAAAAPDEPIFVLRSTDPLAADLVLLWATLRGHHFNIAQGVLERLVQTASEQPPRVDDKFFEATACAKTMEVWKRIHP